MTPKQKKALEFLWFKYGNGGNCHSLANHKFIQRFVEGKDKDAALYERQITEDCRQAVARVKNDDYSEFSASIRKVLETY